MVRSYAMVRLRYLGALPAIVSVSFLFLLSLAYLLWNLSDTGVISDAFDVIFW